MKSLVLVLLGVVCLGAQFRPPDVGTIEFFGLQAVSKGDLRTALGVQEGDPLPPSKADVEERLEQVKNVVWARLEAICCEDDKAVLYVGIEERGAPHFVYRETPNGQITLPQEFIDTYVAFLDDYRKAVQAGRTGESLKAGHSLMEDTPSRRHQEKFLSLADDNLEDLRQVLAESSDPLHRTVAAYAIAYVSAKNKKIIVNDLQAAVRDPQDSVRFNALRSLTAVLSLGLREPALEIPVQATWMVEMLHSLVWSDRRNSSLALVDLTEDRDEKILALLRERSTRELLQMARWKTLAHALPPYLLAGRAAGLPEDDLRQAWRDGSRKDMIKRIEQVLLRN